MSGSGFGKALPLNPYALENTHVDPFSKKLSDALTGSFLYFCFYAQFSIDAQLL